MNQLEKRNTRCRGVDNTIKSKNRTAINHTSFLSTKEESSDNDEEYSEENNLESEGLTDSRIKFDNKNDNYRSKNEIITQILNKYNYYNTDDNINSDDSSHNDNSDNNNNKNDSNKIGKENSEKFIKSFSSPSLLEKAPDVYSDLQNYIASRIHNNKDGKECSSSIMIEHSSKSRNKDDTGEKKKKLNQLKDDEKRGNKNKNEDKMTRMTNGISSSPIKSGNGSRSSSYGFPSGSPNVATSATIIPSHHPSSHPSSSSSSHPSSSSSSSHPSSSSSSHPSSSHPSSSSSHPSSSHPSSSSSSSQLFSPKGRQSNDDPEEFSPEEIHKMTDKENENNDDGSENDRDDFSIRDVLGEKSRTCFFCHVLCLI